MIHHLFYSFIMASEFFLKFYAPTPTGHINAILDWGTLSYQSLGQYRGNLKIVNLSNLFLLSVTNAHIGPTIVSK